MDECELGEDAAKSAYRDALDPENELSTELAQVLQIQQQGIVEGHDLIKSLRNQVEKEKPAYQEQREEFTAQPSYDGVASECEAQSANAPEPDDIEQEKELDRKRKLTALN